MAGMKDPFLSDVGSEVERWSTGRRLAVVGSAALGCLANAGLAFGFSALLPVLIAEGAFHDNCGKGEPINADGACRSQTLALTSMFTIATSLLNVASFPLGFLLDTAGPRFTASLCAVLVGVGCFLFGCGGLGYIGHLYYNAGFMLLAIAGPAVFNCTLSFGNLFPGREGLITASLVGCFDASSAIFVVLVALMEIGVPFRTTFMSYTAIPLLIALASATLWPRKPVMAKAIGSEGEIVHMQLAPLEGRTLWGQLCSMEFALFTWTISVTMVCLNFFIATCLGQMAEVNSENALRLTKVFSGMLPAGGILFIPLIGIIIDSLGPTIGYVLLWACFVLFHGLLEMYAESGNELLAHGTFLIFALCRPLFYTLGASFCGQTFGFTTFGKVYGLVTMIAGLANFAVSPLTSLAANEGFASSNHMLAIAQVTTLALPVYMTLKRRKLKKLSVGQGFDGAHSGYSTPYMERARSHSYSQNRSRNNSFSQSQALS